MYSHPRRSKIRQGKKMIMALANNPALQRRVCLLSVFISRCDSTESSPVNPAEGPQPLHSVTLCCTTGLSLPAVREKSSHRRSLGTFNRLFWKWLKDSHPHVITRSGHVDSFGIKESGKCTFPTCLGEKPHGTTSGMSTTSRLLTHKHPAETSQASELSHVPIGTCHYFHTSQVVPL